LRVATTYSLSEVSKLTYLQLIASGLYYLSEVVEEHTVQAKRILYRLIYTIVVIDVLLLIFDGFPFWLSLLGIISHVIYAGNLSRFPVVKLTDPLFLLSCGMDTYFFSVSANKGNARPG
jgi:hypothetical protein